LKTIFFTGKGGVGKSTIASAVAWQLAGSGKKVLAVSFDPAHNLGDIFGVQLSDRKKRFEDTLYLEEVDLNKASERYIRENIALLEDVYSYLKPFNMERYFQVLKYSPGIEEYASLTAMEELIRGEKEFDYLIFDTPPTGLTLRILALPYVTLSWIERLKRIRSSILEKRYTIHNINGHFSEKGVKLAYNEDEDMVMKKLKSIEERFIELQKFLKSENNSIVVVFNPDFLSLRESERLIDSLDELGMPIRAAIDNKYEESLSELAEEIEGKLLGGKGKNHEIELLRVSKQGRTGEATYELDENLASIFL